MQILIAIGGSEHSQLALHQGVLLAQKLPVSVTILTVIKYDDEAAEAVSLLQDAVVVLETAVSALQTKIRTGDASEQIVAEVQSGAYDLLIIGERPQHSLLSRFLGPTALRIISQQPCPVLIAKDQPHSLEQILVCDSVYAEPPLSERIAQLLPDLLAKSATVTVLHVMSQIAAAPGVKGKQLRADVDELMDLASPEAELLSQDVQLFSDIDVMAEPIVRHGVVVEEILAEAINGRYDLVVIGAHPNEGWQRFLLEDVTAQIVLQADRPILVIP